MPKASNQNSSFFTHISPALFETMPFPLMCLSHELQILYYNKAFGTLFAAKKASLETLGIADIFPELQAGGQKSEALLQAALLLAKNNMQYECPFTFKGTLQDFTSANMVFQHVQNDGNEYFMCYVKPIEKVCAEKSQPQNKEGLLQSLFGAMPLVLHLWSREFQLLDCSSAALELFNVPTKAAYKENLTKFFPAYQPDGFSEELRPQYLQEAFNKGKFSFQWINLDSTGRSFPSEETLCKVTIEGEEYILGYTYDISAATENIRNVSHLEERMRAILDVTPMAINVWDDSLKIRDCNMQSVKMFGYLDKEEFLEQYENTIPKVQPDGVSTFELLHKGMTRAFETGYFHYDTVYGVDKSGELLPLEITYIRLVMRDENVVIAYCRDLREITRVLNELKENEARVQTILNISPLGINVWDKDSNLLDCNDSVVKLLGFSEKEEYLKNRSLVIPATQPDGTDTVALATQRLHEAFVVGEVSEEIVFMNKQGEVVPVEVTFKKTTLHGEERVISFLRDLRELKAMLAEIRTVEESLRTARDVAEQSAKAKSEFLANMSHEIRTPLNGVLGLLHLLSNTALSEAQKDYVEKTIFSASNLLRIINDILDFSKIDAGKLEMESIPFTIQEICSEIKLLFTPQAQAKNLHLEFINCNELSQVLLGDPLRIKQIFFNLVGNAIKFTDEGSITVSMVGTDEGTQVRYVFSVKDSGIGMSQAQCSRLFSAFMQADTSFTRKYGGTGLGLVIARRIARLMQGDLWVESEEGKGSTFFFTAIFEHASQASVVEKATFIDGGLEGLEERVSELPDAAAALFPEKKAALYTSSLPADTLLAYQENTAKTSSEQQGVGRTAHILLVEDNPINQLIAEELLKSVGHTVDIANNGQEALELLQKNLQQKIKYNLVFMDIQMPVMDGFTATSKIRENAHYKDFPVVAMSAHAMTGDKELSLEHGLNDHITKPISPEVLFATVQTWAKFD